MLKVINLQVLLKLHLLISISAALLIYFFSNNVSLFKIITSANLISTIFLFCIEFNSVARILWRVLKIFNKDLFPDLNGCWSGKVLFNKADGSIGEIDITAKIRQSLKKTEIDMYGENMISGALDVSLVKFLGLNKVYYSYISEPPNKAWTRFIGTSILNVINIDNKLTLRGNYYTERGTTGTLILEKN
ncbi:hypothetical protein [Serratia sp. (in: enterobacteria)]|uniref:Cap15 family cyclic dinucleotide receptor domain-containing protein n=1 Tax=Serratia sp. (in: enterobacteria) TaxID=616 RepID=UPI0039894D0B